MAVSRYDQRMNFEEQERTRSELSIFASMHYPRRRCQNSIALKQYLESESVLHREIMSDRRWQCATVAATKPALGLRSSRPQRLNNVFDRTRRSGMTDVLNGRVSQAAWSNRIPRQHGFLLVTIQSL